MSDCISKGHESESQPGHKSFMVIDLEIFSVVIPPSSIDLKWAVLSYWWNYEHLVLVNHKGGLSPPRSRVRRFTDWLDMTITGWLACKTTTQTNNKKKQHWCIDCKIKHKSTHIHSQLHFQTIVINLLSKFFLFSSKIMEKVPVIYQTDRQIIHTKKNYLYIDKPLPDILYTSLPSCKVPDHKI